MANGFGIPPNFRQRRWPRLREYNTLLKVASPIPADVLDGNRWLSGINYDPLSFSDVSCWSDACGEDDDWGLETDDNVDAATVFSPVELRARVTCSTIGLDGAELKDRLQARVDAQQSSRLTTLLVGGDDSDEPCWPNPSIAGRGEDAADQIGSTGDVWAVDAAVARMEDTLADRIGDVLGTIFMPPGMLGLLQNRGGLIFEDGCWWTPSGTAIVADAGVTGIGLENGDPGDPGPHGEFQWLYGTGPVYVHRGPPQWTPDVFAEVGDGPDVALLPYNQVTLSVRQMGIALFDPSVRFRIAAGYASSVFVS